MSPDNSSSWGGRTSNSYHNLMNTTYMGDCLGIRVIVGVLGTNWNQIKRELITMWQIVSQVREEQSLTPKTL
jgi:hypothetical protein